MNKIWCKRGQPWESKVIIEFDNKTEALKTEKHIKSKKIEATLKKLY